MRLEAFAIERAIAGASLSPHREFSPVCFTRPDQHPSAAASDLVSFGGSNDGKMDEITKSWHPSYSSCLRASSSPALTSVDGMEEKGYDSLSPLDESVAMQLCPPTAIDWKAKAAHPSKRVGWLHL